MAFTTWAALEKTMLDALADGSWARSRFQAGDQVIETANMDEFRRMLTWVKTMAATESGSFVGRVRMKNGGRG